MEHFGSLARNRVLHPEEEPLTEREEEVERYRQLCRNSIYHEDTEDYYCGKFEEWNPNCSHFCPCLKEG